ncbi:unnamed protein product [Closterium sp. NIES-54]
MQDVAYASYSSDAHCRPEEGNEQPGPCRNHDHACEYSVHADGAMCLLVCVRVLTFSLTLGVCAVWRPEEIPTQSNSVDCGIYVCMYLHALVSCGFTIIKRWMTFYGQKSHTYRWKLREEVSLHSTGDLVVKLFGEGVEVPLQPLPQLGEFGALVFPKEDEVRTDLARQYGMVTRMELGGYVVCTVVTSLACVCGISEEQLLSGQAHELQTYGTPLLTLSTSYNQVDLAASMKTLASSIHATPCPLPVPSSFWAKVDVASLGQRPESPPQAVPTNKESENPTTPITPEVIES